MTPRRRVLARRAAGAAGATGRRGAIRLERRGQARPDAAACRTGCGVAIGVSAWRQAAPEAEAEAEAEAATVSSAFVPSVVWMP